VEDEASRKAPARSLLGLKGRANVYKRRKITFEAKSGGNIKRKTRKREANDLIELNKTLIDKLPADSENWDQGSQKELLEKR